jgi:hypothetical protein
MFLLGPAQAETFDLNSKLKTKLFPAWTEKWTRAAAEEQDRRRVEREAQQ